MKKLKGVGVLLIALSALPGCDSEQPTQTGARTVTLDFASYTFGELVDVWDRYEDNNGNGVLDPGEPFSGIECGGTYPPLDSSGASLPSHAALWGFAVKITVIRAGELTATSLLPPSAANSFTSVASAGDDRTLFTPDPPIPDYPPNADSAFVYVNSRRMLDVSSDVMLCRLGEIPVANLAGFPLPFDQLTLETGDTLVVTAGRDPTPPLSSWASSPGNFEASLRIDGVSVAPEGIASAADGTISFSYTSR